MPSVYANFEITIGSPSSSGYAISARSPGGDARGTMILPTGEPAYQDLVARLGRLEIDATALEMLGQLLFDALFQGDVRNIYYSSIGSLADDQQMRIMLIIDPRDIAVMALPWEFLYEPLQGSLALRGVSIVRYLQQPLRMPALRADLPLRILLTAAQTPPPVDVARELAAVQAALVAMGHRVQITLDPHLTVATLQDRLRQRFHVWHFVGHGGFDRQGFGQLALEDTTGDIEYVSAAKISALLAGNDVRLVMLNACHGAHIISDPLRTLAPALVQAGMPAVVAMQFAVPQETTRAFAEEFYQALAEGLPIDACVTEGRKRVLTITGSTRPDWGIPVAYTRVLDGRMFDLSSAPPTAQRDLGWTAATVVCTVIALGLTLESAFRFLRIGMSALVSLNFILQIGLTLLAASPLVPVVRLWLGQALIYLHISLGLGRVRAVLALAIVLVMVGLRQSLPAIAQTYNDAGVQLSQAGHLASGIEKYRFAISLAPDDAPAHYNLAVAYEQAVQYDLALNSYQNALLADPEMYLAYNNLARLYIERRNDFRAALELLNQAQQRNPSDPLVRYTLLKNRGWALLGLQLYGEAEVELRQALQLNPQGAAAYCRLAQVLEERPKPDAAAAQTAWEDCLRFEHSGDTVEAELLDRARERLQH